MIPDIKGARNLKFETSNCFILMRVIQLEGETPVAELQSKVRVYAHGEEPGINLVPGDDKPLQGPASRHGVLGSAERNIAGRGCFRA
jgi:hypothetical protein